MTALTRAEQQERLVETQGVIQGLEEPGGPVERARFGELLVILGEQAVLVPLAMLLGDRREPLEPLEEQLVIPFTWTQRGRT